MALLTSSERVELQRGVDGLHDEQDEQNNGEDRPRGTPRALVPHAAAKPGASATHPPRPPAPAAVGVHLPVHSDDGALRLEHRVLGHPLEHLRHHLVVTAGGGVLDDALGAQQRHVPGRAEDAAHEEHVRRHVAPAGAGVEPLERRHVEEQVLGGVVHAQRRHAQARHAAPEPDVAQAVRPAPLDPDPGLVPRGAPTPAG